MPERRSALAECLRAGLYGAPGGTLVISEVTGLAIVQVAAFDEGRAAAAIAAATGATAPPAHGGVGTGGNTRVLWTGPGRWLLLEPESRDLGALLAGHCPADAAAIIDLCHAFTVLRIEGAQARSVLVKLCTLDLDPSAFAPNRSAQTQLGHVGAILDCRGADCFDIAIYRGFAVSACEMLTDAALEVGYQVR
jgi:methylglutamate dehydrogenase subunit D